MLTLVLYMHVYTFISHTCTPLPAHTLTPTYNFSLLCVSIHPIIYFKKHLLSYSSSLGNQCMQYTQQSC